MNTRKRLTEEGTPSTPCDMVVMNDLDCFHLVAAVIDRMPQLGPRAAYAKQSIRDKLLDQKRTLAMHGEDMPEIRHWKWLGSRKKRTPGAFPARKYRKAHA